MVLVPTLIRQYIITGTNGMTPAEVLTEIKQCLIQDGMIATEEAAQSYVNSRESEWDVTEDIISEVGEFCSSVVYATYK